MSVDVVDVKYAVRVKFVVVVSDVVDVVGIVNA